MTNTLVTYISLNDFDMRHKKKSRGQVKRNKKNSKRVKIWFSEENLSKYIKIRKH